jgi:hypothetical protein
MPIYDYLAMTPLPRLCAATTPCTPPCHCPPLCPAPAAAPPTNSWALAGQGRNCGQQAQPLGAAARGRPWGLCQQHPHSHLIVLAAPSCTASQPGSALPCCCCASAAALRKGHQCSQLGPLPPPTQPHGLHHPLLGIAPSSQGCLGCSSVAGGRGGAAQSCPPAPVQWLPDTLPLAVLPPPTRLWPGQ